MKLSQTLTDPIWQSLLSKEFSAPYFLSLQNFLQAEKQNGKMIYPPENLRFHAFNKTPFEKVKVVILGQDPYHGEGQAHGLSFSVPVGFKPPPSLVNIFKELKSDIGFTIPSHGNLEKWSEQGVLLLNTCLSVRAGEAGSHHGKGWEAFTDAVIDVLNEKKTQVIFLLWGSPAQNKGARINAQHHRILKAPHPSPLSAYRGFLGCKHFSQTNSLLRESGEATIDWQLN